MVSVMKGLDVRKSRFAALSLDQDSDDEEDETPWQQVAPTKSKQPPKRGGPPVSGGQAQGEEGKGLSKNAKKRARKRRNKSTSSDQDVSLERTLRIKGGCHTVCTETHHWDQAVKTIYVLPPKGCKGQAGLETRC